MRLDYASVLPAARTAMLGLEKVVHDSGLNPRLLELVKIRASQINGCARCLEMHTKDARALGEEQDRLDLVAAWPEAGCFSERERLEPSQRRPPRPGRWLRLHPAIGPQGHRHPLGQTPGGQTHTMACGL